MGGAECRCSWGDYRLEFASERESPRRPPSRAEPVMIAPLPPTSLETAALLAFGMPGGTEWIILLVLGLLIFGRRLPEVGRSLGKGIVEFKRGIKGIEDEVEEASNSPGKLPESGTPKLAEPTGSSGSTAEVSQATVGGEGANPYAPKEEPGRNG